MKKDSISKKGLSLALGIIWGGALLFVGLFNMKWPGYGDLFLSVVSSIYPGYHAMPTLGSVLIGTCYAVLDGAIAGFLIAWLYNKLK